MKIAFFGTGEFSKNTLAGILKHDDIEVSLIVSQPDKPIGRKKIITPTAVKVLAEENSIPVLQPEKLRNNTEFFNALKNENLDFIIVVAYGKIVPNEVLDAAIHGCINIHGSILPLYRGASPIQESVKNGDKKTGLTIMYMSEGMDEGDILTIEEVEIGRDDTTQDIFDKFENIGSNLLINTLKKVLSGEITGKKQIESNATYCSKIEKQDGQIDFQNPAEVIYNKFKAYKNWPGVFTHYNEKKFSIEECDYNSIGFTFDETFKPGAVCELEENGETSICILCNPGILFLQQIKLEGKKSMDINSFINGNKKFLDYNFMKN